MKTVADKALELAKKYGPDQVLVAFDIDNTPPVITFGPSRAAQGRTTISFDVRDDWSAIQKVEYSLDAQRWQVIYPKDGIFDSPTEQFELTLDSGVAARGLIIRAYDAKNNSVTSTAK